MQHPPAAAVAHLGRGQPDRPQCTGGPLRKRRLPVAKVRLVVSALVCSLSLFPAGALAQTWPSKPVKFINPFPAGGGVDTFARPLSAKLTKQLGQTFFVENQGGAGGTVGATSASRQPGDGYTFFTGAVHHTIAE